jgi:hypothetical protein
MRLPRDGIANGKFIVHVEKRHPLPVDWVDTLREQADPAMKVAKDVANALDAFDMTVEQASRLLLGRIQRALKPITGERPFFPGEDKRHHWQLESSCTGRRDN